MHKPQRPPTAEETSCKNKRQTSNTLSTKAWLPAIFSIHCRVLYAFIIAGFPWNSSHIKGIWPWVQWGNDLSWAPDNSSNWWWRPMLLVSPHFSFWKVEGLRHSGKKACESPSGPPGSLESCLQWGRGKQVHSRIYVSTVASGVARWNVSLGFLFVS